MRLPNYAIVAAALAAVAAPNLAHAQGCPGVFVHDSQSCDNRGDPGSLETVDVVVPKGTRDTFIGYTMVGGRKFYVQLRAFLHDPADIELKPGCVLKRYE